MKLSYLEKRTLYPPFIKARPNKNLALTIVIPAFNEPALQLTLNSLLQNKPKLVVEVILCINYAENSSDEIKTQSDKQYKDLLKWCGNISTVDFSFYTILLKNNPAKKAGVGLARKAAMDEAARRFETIKNQNGIIVNLDADCLVSKNYINSIFNFYKKNETCKAANIYFEHIAPVNSGLSEGIMLYELHLRYIVEALKYCHYPYPYHTVGSSFSVTSLVYQQQGGMNLKKAGEDFYFLHKLFPLGCFGEIADAVVYPSSRSSDRVPFGTGRSIAQWENHKKDLNFSYSFKIFQLIKGLFDDPILFYEQQIYPSIIDEKIVSYLKTQNFEIVLNEIKRNTRNKNAFVKRYFRYWSGFKLWKLIHYLRDNYFENELLINSCRNLQNLKGKPIIKNNNFEMLTLLRAKQKKASYKV